MRGAPKFDCGVVAFGGNAIAQDGDLFSQGAVTNAMGPTLDLFANSKLAIVHGNGPQVGAIYKEVADSGGEMTHAEVILATQDRIGRLFMESMREQSREHSLHNTQVIVDPRDDTFSNPVKGVGDWEEGFQSFFMAGVQYVKHPKTGLYREAVASPEPMGIVDEQEIQRLVNSGCALVCGGGGGVPVKPRYDARQVGCNGEGVRVFEAGGEFTLVSEKVVIDKDLVAGLIGKAIGAQVMLILTNVDGFYENYGVANERLVDSMNPKEVRQRIGSNAKGGGSMNPKLEAAARFAESDSGRVAVITNLDQIGRISFGDWSKATFVSDANLLAA